MAPLSPRVRDKLVHLRFNIKKHLTLGYQYIYIDRNQYIFLHKKIYPEPLSTVMAGRNLPC